MDPAFPLLDLPADLLLNVLSRVQRSARQVSRPFNEPIDAGRWWFEIRPRAGDDPAPLRAVLSRLPQLTELHVPGAFSDVTVFAACTKVTNLYLNAFAMRLANLDVLAPLRRLGTLTLAYLKELTSAQLPAACSKHLTSLTLHCCTLVTEVGPLAHCTALQRLNLFRFEAGTAICAFAACTQLVQLQLRSCCDIRDISPLSVCVLLEDLDLHECGMTSISPLSACRRLQRMDLGSCPHDLDLSVLTSLPALQSLELVCTGIHKLHPVGGCKHLTHLDIDMRRVEVSDTSFVAACQQLKFLGWQHRCLDLDVLSRLGQLTRLHANAACAKNMAALARLTSLIDLHIHLGGVDLYVDPEAGEGFDDITPVGSLSLLKALSLSSCRVADVRCLASCQHLEDLHLSHNDALADISPLAGCPALRSLTLDSCRKVSNVGALAACMRLHTLVLRQCSAVADLSPLLALQGLKILQLSVGTDVSCLSGTFPEKALRY